jgi:DNA modification methylase
MLRLYNQDCLEFLASDTYSAYGTIIMDPPDNLGLGYDGYHDRKEIHDYYYWLRSLIRASVGRCDTLWISVYWEHEPFVKYILWDYYKHSHEMRTFIWSFNFGQYTESDFVSGYRPIIRLRRKGVKSTFDGIKVPSVRSEIGDTRTVNTLRVPSDVWNYPRITGNHSERCSWHPTQHPNMVYSNMILSSGGKVLDLFGGTGTAFRVCNNRIDCDTVEQSKAYCDQIIKAFSMKEGLGFWYKE